MSDNYRKELIQVAASALAAAQVAEMDSTSLGNDNEGVQGRFALERLLNEVREERRHQELKWGTRHSEGADVLFWQEVMLEEVGEVAEEIARAGKTGGLVDQAIELGNLARQRLEMR